jgi:hypothetical protein
LDVDDAPVPVRAPGTGKTAYGVAKLAGANWLQQLCVSGGLPERLLGRLSGLLCSPCVSCTMSTGWIFCVSALWFLPRRSDAIGSGPISRYDPKSGTRGLG